jgi:GT2 family glycosyltransferase
MRTAIAITCFNQAAYTVQALFSLLKTVVRESMASTTIAVFDDCSTDNTATDVGQIAADYGVDYHRLQINQGLTHLWNLAYQKYMDHDLIVLSNNDVIFTPFWLTRIIAAMQLERADVAGPITNGPGHVDEQDVRHFVEGYRATDRWAELKRMPSILENRPPFRVKRINGFCMAFRTSFLAKADTTGRREPFKPTIRDFGNENEIMDRMLPRPLIVPASFVFHYKRISFSTRPRDFHQFRGEAPLISAMSDLE